MAARQDVLGDSFESVLGGHESLFGDVGVDVLAEIATVAAAVVGVVALRHQDPIPADVVEVDGEHPPAAAVRLLLRWANDHHSRYLTRELEGLEPSREATAESAVDLGVENS